MSGLAHGGAIDRSGFERIDYRDGDARLTGWLTRPSGAPRAAVTLYPTIANINPHMERRARMLADAGYLVLIADFYGAEQSDADWQALAQDLRADVDQYRRRVLAAVDALRQRPEAAGLPLAAIGYCMGGQAALEAARAGADLAAVVSFHGLLQTGRKAEAGAIRPRLLICHGDADPMVPRADVLAFWEEMDAAGPQWHFHSYSGVRHGFTDPDSDARGIPAIAYDVSADRQSWAAMISLFEEVFSG